MNPKRNASKIVLILILLCSLLLTGCTEETQQNENNQDGIDDDTNQQDDQNQTNTEEFIGTWQGIKENSQIKINITFYANGTAIFQSNPITWNKNGSTIFLTMFEDIDPTPYYYQFANNGNTLTLNNVNINERFILQKQMK